MNFDKMDSMDNPTHNISNNIPLYNIQNFLLDGCICDIIVINVEFCQKSENKNG